LIRPTKVGYWWRIYSAWQNCWCLCAAIYKFDWLILLSPSSSYLFIMKSNHF